MSDIVLAALIIASPFLIPVLVVAVLALVALITVGIIWYKERE